MPTHRRRTTTRPPADALLLARAAAAEAGRTSAEARLARTGAAVPPGLAHAGQAGLQAACRQLIRDHAPQWSEATLAAQGAALNRAFLRARRAGRTDLALSEWAPRFLRQGAPHA